jgi:hypothetical protein
LVATSLLVYNTATAGAAPNNVTPGYYYWDGVKWLRLLSGITNADNWKLTGNSGTVDGTNFLGTTDNVPLNFRVNNQKAGRIESSNAFFGLLSGNLNSTGNQNSFFGGNAGQSNTTGNQNSYFGSNAGANSTGADNSFFGSASRIG